MSQSANNFFSFPSHINWLKTLLLTTVVIIPFCGDLKTFVFAGVLQLIFIVSVSIKLRHDSLSLLLELRKLHPKAFYLLLAWFASIHLSLAKVIFIDQDISLFHLSSAIGRHIYMLTQLFFTFAVARFFIVSEASLTTVFRILMYSLAALSFFYLFIFLLGPEFSSQMWFASPPLAIHIRDVGNLAAVCAVVGVVFLLYSDSSKRVYVLTFALVLSAWTLLVWTGGRTGIVSSLLTSITVIICTLKYSSVKFYKYVALVFCVLGAFILANELSVFEWNGFQRVSASVEAVQSISGDSASVDLTTGRSKMWALSINAMLASPWLGLGPNGYFFIPERFYGDQPHNLIIQFLVEWGFLGAIPFILLLLYCAYFGIKQLPGRFENRDVSYLSAASVVLVLTLHGLTGGTYYNFQPLFCLSLAFAVFPFLDKNMQLTRTRAG